MSRSVKWFNRNVLVALLAVLVTASYAQQKVDSLKSAFHKAKSDTERVTIFNDIANEYSRADSFRHAFQTVQEALQLSRANNLNKKLAESELNAAVILWRAGFNDTALGYVKASMQYYEKEPPSKTLVREWAIEGGILKDKVEYKQANEALVKGLNIAQQIKDSSDIYLLNNNLGNVCLVNGGFELALGYYKNAVSMALALKQYRDAISSCDIVGSIYAKQGISAEAVKTYFRALDINAKYLQQDEINGVIYVNLGNVYNDKGDTANAMKYYRESLGIFTRLNKKQYIAQLLGNMGNVYMNSGNYTKAEGYELKSMEEVKDLGDKTSMAVSYTNVAEFYNHTKDYPKASEYYQKALELQEQVGDKEGLQYTYSGLGQLNENVGDYVRAEEYGVKSYNLAKEIPLEREVRDQAKILSGLFEKMHQPDKAYEYYKLYINARDSLENKEEAKKLIRAELDHEYEQKQQIEKLEDEKRQAIVEEKQSRERAIRNVFLAAFIVVLFLVALLLRNLTRIRRSKEIISQQKTEVEAQKNIVELKNKDITDSINYARRIQHAILPTTEQWSGLFSDSFIYYRPKDIVSGDFYWYFDSGDEIIFAAADCTGHGVPGAFMSMLGISSLNKIVTEKAIKAPDQILNELREEIIKALNREGKKEEVSDGMDMTLCKYNRASKTLEYAAANNPLWVVSKVNGRYELKDCDADKMPVGKYVGEPAGFKLNKLSVNKGDRIYIFTDGYSDQFGGTKGKKFKYKQLQEAVMGFQDKSMKEQGEELNRIMMYWKGDLEQIDDMLVIGIEI